MTGNNYQRMKIVLDMVDPFDYDEFLMICETEKVYPLPLNEYAMKAGFVMIAIVRYPDLTIEEAYMKIVNDANAQPANNSNAQAGCLSCGQKEDKPLPPLPTEIKNLAIGMKDFALSGFTATDEITLEKRNNICDKCDNMRSDGRCSSCGCYMKIKAKWAVAKCPANKWEVQNGEL